jgi:hypothetical protein
VGGDQPHRAAGAGGDRDGEGAAAHSVQGGAVVVDLHQLERGRQVNDVDRVADRLAAQPRHPDAPAVRAAAGLALPVAVKQPAEVIEGLRVTHFLQPDRVRVCWLITAARPSSFCW